VRLKDTLLNGAAEWQRPVSALPDGDRDSRYKTLFNLPCKRAGMKRRFWRRL